MIDTLKHAKSFEQAGFDKPQAEAIVGALAEMASVAREELATKTDLQSAIHELRVLTKADLNELRVLTKADLNELRVLTKTDLNELRVTTKADLQTAVSELRTEIQVGDAATRSEIAGLRGELIGKIAESRNQTLLAMFGMQAALLGALIALGRFTELLK